jgi:hypothetical protein
MNNIFDIKRFGFVFRKDLMEHWKQYAILFLTMLGIIAIVHTYKSLDYYNIKAYDNAYGNLNFDLLMSSSLMFAAFGLLFASMFMNPMNSKIKRIAYLTCPASDFEKTLSRWIIVTVGYIAAFFTALWITEILRVGISLSRYPEMEVKFLDLSKLFHPGSDFNFSSKNGYFFGNAYLFAFALSIYFLLQSIFILGSTFWEKAAFVKTFTAGAAISLAFILVCRRAILLAYGDFDGFGNVLGSFKTLFGKEIVPEQAFTFVISVISFFTLVNWTISFLSVRESEIIKRL